MKMNFKFIYFMEMDNDIIQSDQWVMGCYLDISDAAQVSHVHLVVVEILTGERRFTGRHPVRNGC
jgi:hypothetical protein